MATIAASSLRAGLGDPPGPSLTWPGPRPRKGRPQGVAQRREYRTERKRGRNGPALEGPGWHYAGRTQAGRTTVSGVRGSVGARTATPGGTRPGDDATSRKTLPVGPIPPESHSRR